MDLGTDQYFDVIGHNFLDTIDLDVMEQTIIDDVMAEISVTEHITMTEPVNISRCKSEPAIVETHIPRTRSEPVLKDVIEAFDAEGLLAQFEEASQSMDDKDTKDDKKEAPVFTLQTPVTELGIKQKCGNTEKMELSKEMIQKLKAVNKPKSAVMLPLAVPAKRGRGRAMARGHPVTLSASCTPRRLHRVMMQNSELKESFALAEVEVSTECSKSDTVDDDKVVSDSAVGEKVALNSSEIRKKAPDENNHFEHVFDHDYIKNSFKTDPPGSVGGSNSVQENDVNVDIEEGELVDEDLEKDRSKNQKMSNYRDDLPVEHSDPAQFFDKLPSYYTALSIPRKQVRKTASCVTGRGGITVNDYFERDVSPIRDPSTYSKLPEYCSSFTNSTRYDSLADDSVQKCNNDSKASSGYASSTHSSDHVSQRSRSRSHSRTSSTRSFSRSRSLQRSRKKRKSSYSSCSGYSSSSSSCSASSCSNSSCCRSSSSSCSRSRSRSLSSCCSRASSISIRSSKSRSRSRNRSWRRERELRKERSRRSFRSRSRKRSRSRRRRSGTTRSSLHSYSRSRSRSHRRYRSRSNSRRKERQESLERFRELRRKQREDEKEQQMKERRIVYVGGLPNKYSRHTLRDHFTRFGPIENVQLHFREHGDNYGFVTFTYTCDAFAAIEKGKKIPGLSQFDLCFGGRRQFCDVEYADLDGNKEIEEEFDSKPPKRGAMDFDELLRQAKAGIKKV